jgi:uncharacterized protein
MILGILSDTHGRSAIAAEAIKVLQARGASYFIHCGDVGDGVLELLPREASAFVFGNNDFDRHGMIDLARDRQIVCLRDGGTVKVFEKTIAVTHGDDARALQTWTTSGLNDYVFSGHTHVPHDRRLGRTRHINPGALYRAARKTVATLDLAGDLLTFHTIDRD